MAAIQKKKAYYFLKRNLGRLMLYFSANRRAIKITKPEIIAAKVVSIFRDNNKIKNNDPSQETVHTKD